jgi:hypothetical protein
VVQTIHRGGWKRFVIGLRVRVKLTKEEDEEDNWGKGDQKKRSTVRKAQTNNERLRPRGKRTKFFSRCDVGKDGNNVLGGGEINK